MLDLADKFLAPLREQHAGDKPPEYVAEDEPRKRGPHPCKISPRSIFELLYRYRIAPQRFTVPEPPILKQGASADVQLAILQPIPPKLGSRKARRYIVALKKFRLDDNLGDKGGLVPMAHELSLLSNLAHKNIVNMVGFVEDVAQGVAWIVFPWATNGTLREFIHSKDCKGLFQRASLIKDIVSGMEYLHNRSHPICHGDLKSLNILINEEYNAVITDFGSARTLNPEKTMLQRPRDSRGPASRLIKGPSVEFSTSTESITLTGPAWTIRWAAPELLNGEPPSLASDIWALGWICWEVLTGDLPFNSVKRENEVIIRIIGGNIPNIAEYFDSPQVNFLCRLIESCWTMDPDRRPSAIECHSSMSLVATSADAERTLVEEEHMRSLDVSQTIEQTHLVEGRSGKGIQDLLKLRTFAQRTGKHYEFIDCQAQLDNYRRSAHGIKTVSEEEAVRAWNMALELTAADMFQEAEKQLLHAAFHYVQVGFWTQVSECEQFVEGLQEAMRSPPSRPPLKIPLLLPQIGSREVLGSLGLFCSREHGSIRRRQRLQEHTQPVPKISHATYSQEYGLKDLAWFAAGALEQASPGDLTEDEIFSLIKEYQPWRIAHELNAGRDEAFVINQIKQLLVNSGAFVFWGWWYMPPRECWRLKYPERLPAKDIWLAYDLPLGSSDRGLDLRIGPGKVFLKPRP